MFTAYDGKYKGISDVQIKNIGDKTIDELTVTVYFQDENGNDMAEDSCMIIGGYYNTYDLKPNYSYKMEKDKFMKFEHLPDEVDISKHRVEITDIHFA